MIQTPTSPQKTSQQDSSQASEARIAAAVEAAYILEAVRR
jgi:hypothetical protein